jgi:hypothetical protein
MGEKKRRSKKRSTSNKQRPLKGFTLYLCNCVDYDEVFETLSRNGIRCQRHRNHFKADVPDIELLKKVGQRRWILITADKRQRIRPIERQMIRQYRVREFVINSPKVGSIGELLVRVRRKMRNLCAKNGGPFVASITAAGNITLKSIDGVDNPILPNSLSN